MLKAKTRPKPPASAIQVIPAPDPVHDARDGPTAQFRQHRDVVDRKDGGKRVCSRVEQMLMTNDLTPAQCDAGLRIANDYRRGVMSGGKSCLAIMPRGNDAHPTEDRLDAARRFRLAQTALSAGIAGGAARLRCTIVMLFLIDDHPFTKIGKHVGMERRAVKASIIASLMALEQHYALYDRTAGRSSTLHDKTAMLKRFDPVYVAP